jgi:hypothetical protein
MTEAIEALLEKVRSLPPEQRSEVEDFVDFLASKKRRERADAAERLDQAFAKLDALSMAPLGPADVEAEIKAARAERHADHR